MRRLLSRSVTFKWSITLLLSSLTGVLLVGLFAYRTTVAEYDRFRSEQAKSTFVTEVTTYYQEHNSWDGLGSWLHSLRFGQPDQGGGQGQGGPPPPQSFALADNGGTIVLPDGPFRQDSQVPASLLKQGTPI